MGTQQILMLVIGVIIVGLAITVGFVTFNNGSYNSNKSAIAVEMQELSTRLMQYWMLPTSMGGASQLASNVSVASVGKSLGFLDMEGVYKLSNDNGEYRVLSVNGSEVKIAALGNVSKKNKFPYAVLTVDLLTQEASTVLGEQEGF
jgi:hypothetical protein